MDLVRIQQALREEQLSGWLFYDFRRSNPIAYQVLGLPANAMYTRRWFYFIPAQGQPVALISAVEAHVLRSLPGNHRIFRTWQEMQSLLQSLLQPGQRVAMEYSPLNAIPYISRVDAGTIELVRSFGAEVVTSANLVQRFVAQLSTSQIEGHRRASRLLMAAKDLLFAELSADLRNRVPLDEYSVQQRFFQHIQQAGLITPDPPIVAVNENASNPHYSPASDSSRPFRRGDLVLFDFWAKLPEPEAIFVDYTWMAFIGSRTEIPQRQHDVFDVARRARDTGIAFIRERLAAAKSVEGREVDDVTRAVIVQAGYGDFFVHRTGHNIGILDHGDGANNDNYESQDTRRLLPYTCCSIEPGIYLPEFGVRTEIDLLIFEHDVEVTGVPAQEEITPLL
ncbi:MAG TPA: M24 family metallopeptidase [Ktedonobacteraceae bacterium]|jgi:Xaa-Pro aminopeptidase